jgi:formylglycine-generating enzyme required for sulfatase activity/energy-coupling factor transporter ATP-binding protein EcfA2
VSSSASLHFLAATRPKYPYPGLRPFEAEEWSIFFGRERMIDDVIGRLAANRLVMVHGSSGSGKSSLIRAGVLPKLARQHLRAGAPWRTCSIRPSGGPLWNLAKELARLEGNGEDLQRVGQIIAQFSQRNATLSAVVGSLKNGMGRRLCILVDQFEELFRFEKETSRDEAELFVDLLVRNDVQSADAEAGVAAEVPAIETAEQSNSVHVIVTMRSEFLGECARFDGLAEAINRTQYLVPRMDREGLVRAIRRPAQLYGAEVSAELAELLMAEVAGREDELPLIQHGLMFLWNAALEKPRTGGKIVLDAAALESKGGLARLLSSHADVVIDAAAPDPERQFAVERLFRALIDLNVEGKAIRRPQAFRDLVAVTQIGEDKLRAIIDALRRDEVSFLTPYAPAPIVDGTPIDISHEALIRCWNRLSDPQDGWLRREFDDGLTWRSLLVEAKGFEKDTHRVLSPATTDERWAWWRQRKLNSSWAERYGGGFALVEKLIAASRRYSRRRQVQRHALIGMLLLISGGGIAYAVATNLVRLQLMTDLYVRGMVLSAAAEQALKPLQHFQECSHCPEMVVIPAGSFTMGSPENEEGREEFEGPQHRVTIGKPFAVSKTEVTFEQWDACVELGGCRRPEDSDWGRGKRPVIEITWYDAQNYVTWLSKVTGKSYRLLTEAEFEYAARAGTTTPFYWGETIGTGNANCNECGSRWEKQTAPVGSFPPNPFGLYDMAGNVDQWVQDCHHDDYIGAPTDGSAWTEGPCAGRVTRGGAWFFPTQSFRTARRGAIFAELRSSGFGMRVARTLGR